MFNHPGKSLIGNPGKCEDQQSKGAVRHPAIFEIRVIPLNSDGKDIQIPSLLIIAQFYGLAALSINLFMRVDD